VGVARVDSSITNDFKLLSAAQLPQFQFGWN
jgi:hypothetical protein